jgi:uncharacterized protein (DUF2141 family)
MRAKSLFLAAMLALLPGAAPDSQRQLLSMGVQDLRSGKGNLLICIVRSPAYFPDCSRDPDKRHLTVPVSAGAITLGEVAPGDYAIAIIHDENGNGKLDTFAGIPREGVGFSRNPAIRFGAPSFRSAQFAVTGSAVRQEIKIKYFL